MKESEFLKRVKLTHVPSGHLLFDVEIDNEDTEATEKAYKEGLKAEQDYISFTLRDEEGNPSTTLTVPCVLLGECTLQVDAGE